MSSYRCHLCNKKLKRPTSLVAGIGPSCNKKIKYLEQVSDPNILHNFAKNKIKPTNEMECIKTTLLLKKNQTFLATILKKKKEKFIFFDRKKVKESILNGKSLTESYLDNLELDIIDGYEYFSEIGNPSEPDIERSYKRFSNKYNQYLEEYEFYKLFKEKKFYYKEILSTNELNSKQRKGRDKLLIEKKTNELLYNEKWNNGEYQISTFISRLQKIDVLESKELVSFLKKKISIDVFDYGLTDAEIFHSIKKKRESYSLIKLYLNKSRNLMMFIKIFRNIKNLNEDQVKKIYKKIKKELI